MGGPAWASAAALRVGPRGLDNAGQEVIVARVGRTLLTALLVLAGLSTGAWAEQARRDPRPGTFFLLEAGLGYGVGEAFAESPDGLTTGVTLGFGGKPKGWPLRFFGIMRLSWADLSGRVETALERSEIERDVFDWAFGLRIIAPISGRFRFIVDTTFGGTQVASRATLGGGAERIASDDGSFLVAFGFGLQYRLHYNFSLGARMDVALPTGLETFDALAEAAGASSDDAGLANLGWGLTATLHF